MDQRMLEARITALEKQVAFLLRINGLDLSGMRQAKDEDLLKLYQDAAQLTAVIHKGVDLEVIERWSEFFIQLTELEFVRLQKVIDFDHPWEPFFLLCVKMLTQVRQDPKIGESLRLQNLYALLNKGRKNLRDSAVVMCQKYSASVSTQAKVLLKNEDLLAYLV